MRWLIFLLLLLGWPAQAQTVSGIDVTQCPLGQYVNQITNAGAVNCVAAQTPVGGAPAGSIITTGDSVVGGRCDYSNPIDSPTGYYRLCLDASSNKIVFNSTNTTPGSLNVEINGASWPATFGAMPTNGLVVQTGAIWPIANQIPAGVMQVSVSTMTIPASYTQGPWPNTNFSGYCDNQNTGTTGNSCVPYFSVGLANGNANTTAYGTNQIISNTDKSHYLVGTGFGKDFGALMGNECNPNVWTKPGGATPTGYLRCFEAIGGGNVVPIGGAIAFHVSPFAAGLGWTTGFEIQDGGAVNGIALGAAATGTSQLSLGINFRVYDALAAERTASVYAAPNATSVELRLAANDPNGRIAFYTSAGQQYYIDATGFHGGTTALTTGATYPFVYIGTMAGMPTGTPTISLAGTSPLVVDTTNHKLCWFEQPAGAWKCAAGS